MAINSNINAIEINLIKQIKFKDKKEIRKILLRKWIKEKPSTKYRYFVEKLNSNNRIYLERPGRLNKGCDFVIFIENHAFLKFKNGNDKPPTHEFIFNDLKLKKSKFNKKQYCEILTAIIEIYHCKSYESASKHIKSNTFVGEDVELILKTLKWFFIEQDITYWNSSGRQMLFDRITKI